MYKRKLRSGLAVAFSAGLILGTAGALDTSWDSAKSGVAVVAGAVTPPDTSWDSAPAGLTSTAPPDTSWDFAPANRGA